MRPLVHKSSRLIIMNYERVCPTIRPVARRQANQAIAWGPELAWGPQDNDWL